MVTERVIGTGGPSDGLTRSPRMRYAAGHVRLGKGQNMTFTHIRRALVATAIAGAIAGVGVASTAAQENLGSAVTVGGGVNGGVGGETVVVAPGVTISGGDVTNSTGIGIDSGGGSSIGTTVGGDDSAAVVE